MSKKKNLAANNTCTIQKGLDSLLDLACDTGGRQVKNFKEGNESLGKALKNYSSKKKKQMDLLLDLDDFNYREIKKISDDNKMHSLAKGKDLASEFKNCISKSKMNRQKEEALEEDLLSTVSNRDVIEAQLIEEIPTNMQNGSVVKASVVTPVEQDEDMVIKDKALRIAMDFVKHKRMILVDGKEFIYNGKFYVPIKDLELQSLLFNKYLNELAQGNTVTVVANAAKIIRLSIKDRLDEFPVNQNLIVFENGTLEVETGVFRHNSPNDYANSALGIRYQPKCTEMPNIQRFLDAIADGDDDLYLLMLQSIGYILSNDLRAKSFFYLEGVGNAGKSRFCDLVASFFQTKGANTVARVSLQDLGGRFSVSNLVNAKLNISEDLPNKALCDTAVSRIKMISDANRLEAEAKFEQAFSFRPTCKLLFASNHPLSIKEYDKPFVDRVVYIPFLRVVPQEKQDKNILEKMQPELPALFNHAFKAYMELKENGYKWAGAEKFKPRIHIVDGGIVANKEHELKEFIQTCCIFKEECKTSVADLQARYNLFCENKGYSPIQGNRFSRELRQFLPETVTPIKFKDSTRGYDGISILKSYPSDDFFEYDD